MVNIRCILQGFPSRPYVASWINISGYRPKPILFLIDTGSYVSFLSPTDAESMGIILSRLPNPPTHQHIISIAGLIPNHDLGLIKEYDAKFISDNSWFQLFDQNLLVLKQDHGYKLPSILGVDFLVKNGLKLILDHSRNFAELNNNNL